MHHSPFTPGTGCSSCTQAECPLSEGDCDKASEAERSIRGGKFSAVCALVFLLPILLAMIGSMALRQNQAYALAGGAGGFFIGWFIATLITRMTRIETK
jgi:hypothetical protein